MRENSHQHLSTRNGYAAVAICSILLVWYIDLLEIITLASRAFATYYFLQTVLAIFYNFKDCPPLARVTIANQVLFVTLAIVLAYVIIFSIPAGQPHTFIRLAQIGFQPVLHHSTRPA